MKQFHQYFIILGILGIAQAFGQGTLTPSPSQSQKPPGFETTTYYNNYSDFYTAFSSFTQASGGIIGDNNDLGAYSGLYPSVENVLFSTLIGGAHLTASFDAEFEPVENCPAHPTQSVQNPAYIKHYLRQEKKEVNHVNGKWEDCFKYVLHEYSWDDQAQACTQKSVTTASCWYYN